MGLWCGRPCIPRDAPPKEPFDKRDRTAEAQPARPGPRGRSLLIDRICTIQALTLLPAPLLLRLRRCLWLRFEKEAGNRRRARTLLHGKSKVVTVAAFVICEVRVVADRGRSAIGQG